MQQPRPDGMQRFSRSRRIKISFVAWLGYWALRLIGGSVRWESAGSEHLEEIYRADARAIFTCWHGRIFPATWYWRNRGIVVMTSLNFDGEAIARTIKKLGYGAARGSSSRGGLRALAGMVQEVRNGNDVGFTIDGPRGPRYIAKQGPAILARKTGAAIFCFHVALKSKIQFNSWDHFQVPYPFTRAMVFEAAPIWIASDADEDQVRDCRDEMQRVLDGLKKDGDSWEREQSGWYT